LVSDAPPFRGRSRSKWTILTVFPAPAHTDFIPLCDDRPSWAFHRNILKSLNPSPDRHEGALVFPILSGEGKFFPSRWLLNNINSIMGAFRKAPPLKTCSVPTCFFASSSTNAGGNTQPVDPCCRQTITFQHIHLQESLAIWLVQAIFHKGDAAVRATLRGGLGARFLPAESSPVEGLSAGKIKV